MRHAHARRAITLIAAVLSCTAAYAVPITPVAVGGKPVDGVPNHTFRDFTSFHLSDSGMLSLHGGATPSGGGPFAALWGGTVGNLQLVARAGGQVPGAPAGTTFRTFYPNILSLNITTDGRIVFGANITHPGGGDDDATFAGPLSAPAMIARNDGPVHGSPGMTYSAGAQFAFPSHIEAGRIAFAANALDAANPSNNFAALWEGPLNSPTPLFRSGQQVPGQPDGVLFQTFGAARTSLNGSLSFEANLTGASVTPQDRFTRWSGSFSDPKLAYRRGLQAPGLPDGVVFTTTDSTFFFANDAGQIVQIANLSGPGIDTSNDSGIWLSGTTSHLIAREGSQAPGLPAGTVFANPTGPTFLRFDHNNRSDVAFTAIATGSGGGTGLWSGQPGNAKLIAMSGNQVPGFSAGTQFGTDVSWLALSDNGGLAFLTNITGKQDAIFATDSAGNLEYITGSGNLLHVGDNQFRTVSTLSLFDFNTLNQIAFIATFTDGTQGAFIATVPEPSSLLLLTGTVLLIPRRRRHR
jgi:hypothetical protein